jgi:hypothetical protein
MNIVSKATSTPFLVKLWSMLEDADNRRLISWSAGGGAFRIAVGHVGEMEQLLPLYFRSQKFTSFLRQLKYYGFKKGARGKDRKFHHWHHKDHQFHKDRPKDVLKIKRRANTGNELKKRARVKKSKAQHAQPVVQALERLEKSCACSAQMKGDVESYVSTGKHVQLQVEQLDDGGNKNMLASLALRAVLPQQGASVVVTGTSSLEGTSDSCDSCPSSPEAKHNCIEPDIVKLEPGTPGLERLEPVPLTTVKLEDDVDLSWLIYLRS